MATKATKAMGGTHTAGIYADMTVDGPEIGTLVVIVDRAKNLPNRKSMGKQDPYCAARLGKEAKKTDTDKRGGQTPKWDQELRFTVHESPDYYQLKVSVFNDDKRTELIGETRIALVDIIIPGGGQNDTWHGLHCKGRFAGEIRIELTYYDTRPKEDKLPDRQGVLAADRPQEAHRDSVGGPRGPKPLKRRPLPANPVDHSRPGMPEHAHSSPLPHPPQPMIHQPIPSYPEPPTRRDHWLESTPPSGSRNPHLQHSSSTGSQFAPNTYDEQWLDGEDNNSQLYDQQPTYGSQMHSAPMDMAASHYHDQYEEHASPVQPHSGGYDRSLPVRPQQGIFQPDNRHRSLPPVASFDQGQYAPEQAEHMLHHEEYSQSPPALPHGYSMPDVRTPIHPRVMGHQDQPRSLPHSRGYTERSPVSQLPPESNFDPYTGQHQAPPSFDQPPPPPVHRKSHGTNASPLGEARSYSESSMQVAGTAPLNIRKERGSFSNSALSQVQTISAYPDDLHESSGPPSNHYSPQPAVSGTRQAHASPTTGEPYQRRSLSPVRNGQSMPASLVPGYEPQYVAGPPDNVDDQDRMEYRPVNGREHASPYQPTEARHMQPQTQHAATIHAQSPLQALERGSNQRPHRASAPVVQPRAISSDPRMPMRKSVSPQPEVGQGERRGSGVPFGPDSYDAFNPYVGSASAGVTAKARYETPEQAQQAAIQHEREKKLGDGPIIGNDGRVIDPSDHLPTDTWAPEPEVKNPKKTAQVNFRFRNAPQGAQPMPPSNRRAPHDGTARPASISTPVYSHNGNSLTENISPTNAARARLQKKTRMSPAHPHSSPIVPTVNTALQNPVMRSTASDYPLQEHENYGYGNSPTYHRPSPTGRPPPVPGKIPMGMGQEDWRGDPLSEELSRIDIGVGGGRARRNQYGR
ncbi:MAG: hypothetical protein Q9220_002298 [cf. Caloplaca sp. 1 TL-2023]